MELIWYISRLLALKWTVWIMTMLKERAVDIIKLLAYDKGMIQVEKVKECM